MKAGREYRSSQRGFTVVELMVSVTILVILIGAFGLIITQAQKVVNTGQTAMKANAISVALADAFRQDCRQITQNGFICLTQAANGTPQLFFSTAGATPSITGGPTGMGAFVGCGICPGGRSNVLWKTGWVLNQTSTGDGWQYDLADVQRLSRQNINSTVGTLSSTAVPTNFAIPPQNLTDVGNLWQCLSTDCPLLAITWSDGSLDAAKNLNWCGVVPDKDGYIVIDSTKDGAWKGRDVNAANNGIYYTEFGASGAYRALWTNGADTSSNTFKRSSWPRNIKFCFWVNQGQETDKIASSGGNSIAVYNAYQFQAGDVIQPIGSKELIYVTAVNGNTLTVTRGYCGTAQEALKNSQGVALLFQYEIICPVGR